jgi:hypothetical protein
MEDSLMLGQATFVPAGQLLARFSYVDVTIDVDFMQYVKNRNEIFQKVTNGLKHFVQQVDTKAAQAAHLSATVVLTHKMDKVIAAWRNVENTINQDREENGFFGIIGSIIAIGTSLYALHEVEAVAARQDADHAHIVENRHLIKKVEDSIVSLAGEQTVIRGIQEFEMHALVVLEEHLKDVLNLEDTILAAQMHTLHSSMLTEHVTKKVIPSLKAKLKKADYEMLEHGYQPLLNHPISYVLGTKGLRLLLHVPIAKQPSTLMTLWHLQEANLEGRRISAKIHGAEEFIAIDRKGRLSCCSDSRRTGKLQEGSQNFLLL